MRRWRCHGRSRAQRRSNGSALRGPRAGVGARRLLRTLRVAPALRARRAAAQRAAAAGGERRRAGAQVQFLDREHLLFSMGPGDHALLRSSSDISAQARPAAPRRPSRPPALRGGDRAASRACGARALGWAAGRVWKQDRQPCGMLAGMLLPARPLQRAAAPRMRRHASGALARTRQAAGRAGSLPRVTAGGGGAACARAAPSRARLRRSAIALGG